MAVFSSNHARFESDKQRAIMIRLARIAAVAAMVQLAGTGQGLTEEATRWVDPPSKEDEEKVTYPDPPAVTAKPAEAPRAVEPEKRAVTAKPPEASSPEPVEAKSASTAAKGKDREEKTKTVRKKAPPKKAVAAKTKRKATTRNADRRKRSDVSREAAVPPHRARFAPPPVSRPGSLQDAIDAGYRVTTVRTYFLPDGRRVEVVTEFNR
jgi:hypothetical protein